MSRSILPFDHPDARSVSRAGGKGARLAEMAHAGVPVPPGFVVTTHAWRELLGHEGRERQIQAVLARITDRSPAPELESAAAELHALVAEPEPPSALVEELRAAYDALAEGLQEAEPVVAVRSSATAEDSEGASFAGQYESYLWVTGLEAILRSIRMCWASMFTPSGLSYVLRDGEPGATSEMGVVVQAMVRARASGVMFTCDPASGDPSLICIEGSWGLGSAVVGAEVTPDQFTVDKPTMSIRDSQVRVKESRHVPDEGGGVRVEPVPDSLAGAPCLEDEEVVELARVGRSLERSYGGPQDIEWSVDERFAFPDNLFVVQCRPETAWRQRRTEPVLDPDAGALAWIAQTLSRGA